MISQAILHLRNSFMGIPRPIWLLSLVSLINRTGTMVVAFLTLYLTQSLHFDIRSAGYVMSFYGLGSILGAYIGGYLTDKIGYYKVQWLSLTFTGIILLIVMLIRDFWWMCGAMFLFSLIAESFPPANSVAIRMHSDEATRTRSFSLMRVSVNLAITVALSVGGILVALGWKWLFWVDSLTCFGAAAILLIYFKDNHIPPQLKSTIRKDSPIETSNSAYRDKKYLFFIFLTFIGATVFMQLLWTVPAFFKQVYGWTETQIGLMSALNGFVVMLVEMPLVYQIEGKRSPIAFVRFGIILYALAYAMFLLPVIQGMIAATLYMVIISFGEIFVMPFSSTWSVHRASDARQGQYLALYSMAYSVSNVVAPFVGTQTIAAYGFNALWLLLVVLSAGTLLGFLFLEIREK